MKTYCLPCPEGRASICVTALVLSLVLHNASAKIGLINPEDTISTTTKDFVNIAGRTTGNSTATVAGVNAPVYSTGVFVRDKLPLQLGLNRIPIVVEHPQGVREETIVEIQRVPVPQQMTMGTTGPLRIAPDSIRPAEDTMIWPGEVIEASFHGTPGQRAECELPSGKRFPLTEETDPGSSAPTGRYRGIIALSAPMSSAPLVMRLRERRSFGARRRGKRAVETRSRGRIGAMDTEAVVVGIVPDDYGQLSFGLHEVRLGGPYLAELTSGTALRVIGERGSNYHVQLSSDMDAWIDKQDIVIAPPGTPIPHLAFTSISAAGDETSDVITIPYDQPAPFSIRPAVDAGGRAALEIDFYGAHNAATWLSHRPTAKTVREVSVEQIASGHLRVHIGLKMKQLWGYRYEVIPRYVKVYIRRPPELADPAIPLKGLTVAVEPGHGGRRDRGAPGVSGTDEKDVNLSASLALADELTSAGAQVILLRQDDRSASLPSRARRAMEANADLFISIHANSASQEGGYSRVSGMSTYYKYSFCRDMSEAIHARLLKKLQIGDFGNVGNFNYYPLRALTWMPSMLVEQAFMSNPQDEAMMLDPRFRGAQAEAIREGIEDFLRNAESKADK